MPLDDLVWNRDGNLGSVVEASKVLIEFDVGKSGLGTKNHQGSSRTIESNRGSKTMDNGSSTLECERRQGTNLVG